VEYLALTGAAAAVLGSILGSFLNALVFRFNTGRSIAKGRSRCMRCNHELAVLDLVPMFSYLFLRGRCRYCGAKISIQYPMVEAIAALLSLVLYFQHPQPVAYAFWLLTWMVLLFIIVYDVRHTIIPWSASFILLFLAFASIFFSLDSIPPFFYPPNTLALLAGPILALPLTSLSFVSKGTWMGWGDGLLELSLGWLLGLTAGLTALVMAFWIGAAVGVGLLLLTRRAASGGTGSRGGYTMRSELPFAPFLVLGACIVQFFHVDLFQALPFLF
jgi:leader peptidase (prepilin peptidase)/N-methyltransferase